MDPLLNLFFSNNKVFIVRFFLKQILKHFHCFSEMSK